MLSDFYKYNSDDEIWWVDEIGAVGKYLFSFDKKKIYNFFEDYPDKLTEEQKKIFRKENPTLAELKEGSTR